MPTRFSSVAARLLRRSPLRHPTFRRFYLGSAGTALGYTMQATLAAWLMATLTPSALMVALVQTASTTPALLFGLAAGALGDIVDRRKVLLVSEIVLLGATLVLGAAAVLGELGPPGLLALTFLIGAGFTFYLPTQQAMINDLVPHAELPNAVALGAVAFNVSRAIGPALAGALAAWISSGHALLASALLFIGMIVALRGLPASKPAIPGIPETVLSGVTSGIRFARHSPPLRALIQRNMSFSLCASALWALLPVVARDQFGMGAGGFGLLFASFGAGAVAAAFTMPRQLRRLSLNTVVNAGFVLWAVAAAVIAWTPIVTVALAGAACAGAAWVSVLASLSAGTQSSAPAWVRTRALAMNLVSMQASLALGSAVWGWSASMLGTRITLGISAAAILVLLLVNRRARVALATEASLKTGWLPEISAVSEPLPDDGPVLIQIEYRIERANRTAFLHAIGALEGTRRRNGASAWRLFRDLEDDERFLERYIIGSWAEYVRLRARLTSADMELQERVSRLQRAGVPVKVSRLLGVALDAPPDRAG